MGWIVNNLPLIGIIEVIMEGIDYIRNINVDMLGVINGNNQTKYR